MQITTSTLALKLGSHSVDKAKEAKLKKACHDFEAIMLKQMLTTMRKSVPHDGLFKTGYTGDMYDSMRDEQLARNLASGRGIGIADLLYKQISGEIKQTTK